MKPITPQECKEQQSGSDIPEFVIDAVNNLLRKHCRNVSITLKQNEIIDEICRVNINVSRTQIFANKWLDFEPLFERAGWDIVYDKPAYCETYDATFTFTPTK